jgi:hypothetical protein
MRTFAAVLTILLLNIFAWAETPASQPASSPAATPNEKRELLAEQDTVAKFTGIAYQQCRGMTAQCPDNCGQSGDFASFAIVSYLTYRKPGQYGDPKATTYTFQVEDNHRNLKVPKELAAGVRGLKPGDYVLLSWRHDYVTRFEGGGSASFPERPITKLQKISKGEADRLLKKPTDTPAIRPASRPATAPTRPAATQPDIATLIADLSSEDGTVKVAATKAIFALGKDALEPLKKAGAKQVSPFGTIGSRRIDVVFSLLGGLKPNPVGGRAGYKTDSFGLHVEWGCGCTQENVVKMGERHGFVISGDYRADSTPTCYVKLKPGKNLADVLKAVLSEEPQIISVSLSYFET